MQSIIDFNTETINYPKFEIYNKNNIFKINDIIILIIGDIQDINDICKNINIIIDQYELIEDLQFITKYLDFQYSFILIDLNIHKPQYKIFLVIKQYDIYNYYLTNDMKILVNTGNNSGIKLLKPNNIHLFTLDYKVLSLWKYEENDTYNINSFIKTNIIYNDFCIFIVKEYEIIDYYNYGVFLLDILKSNLIYDTPILYNYNVEKCINNCKFSINEYITNEILINSYLLIDLEQRFIERYNIINFINSLKTE
jgi:hypothetical protein